MPLEILGGFPKETVEGVPDVPAVQFPEEFLV